MEQRPLLFILLFPPQCSFFADFQSIHFCEAQPQRFLGMDVDLCLIETCQIGNSPTVQVASVQRQEMICLNAYQANTKPMYGKRLTGVKCEPHCIHFV